MSAASTKERLYRSAIAVEWADLYPTYPNRLKAYRAIAWEILDLEMGIVDELIRKICESSGQQEGKPVAES